MIDHVTEDYRRRWQEAQEEASRRQDEHTRTMIVMLEKRVETLFLRCQETWTQADEQKAVIGGLLTKGDEPATSFHIDQLTTGLAEALRTIDEMKAAQKKLIERTAAKFSELETKFSEGRLGE